MKACCFGRRAPLHLKQIQVVSTIYFDLSVDTAEILDNVSYSEEESFLLDILERFDGHHVNSALREYFGLQNRNKLPDFVDAEKL